MFSNSFDHLLHSVSTNRSLAERIAMLEARHRPEAVPIPPLATLARNFSLVRIRGIGRFRQENTPRRLLSMLTRIQHVLNSLAASEATFFYLLGGQDLELFLYLGIQSQHRNIVESLLTAFFPGSKLEPVVEGSALPPLKAAASCHLLAGVPQTFDQDSMPDEQIDYLVRGLLYGEAWALVVIAQPLRRQQNDMLADGWADGVEQARLEFQQPGTPGEQSRQGQHLVELLEAQFERAGAGRASSNWLVQSYVLGEGVRAGALAVGTLGGVKARPEPLRLIPCYQERNGWQWRSEYTTWLNSEELAHLIQFPQQEYTGYNVQTAARFDVDLAEGVQQGLNLGWVQDVNKGTGRAFLLDKDDVAGHVLVAGTTNSGKTNTAFHLLQELRKQQIPFLVIEPTKGEYRYLRAAFSELRLFTLGSPEAPVELNPFYVPEGIQIQTHLDYLLSLFAASFVLYAPMPYVLESALHEVYADKGWDLATNQCRRDPSPGPRAFPTLSDLYDKVGEVVDRLGYDTRITMDVQAGLRARINSLRVGNKGVMLDTRAPFDVEGLLSGPAVMEMVSIGDDEQKAFLMGLLLMRIYEHYQAQGVQVGDVRLKHVTVIEEAHRLLQNVTATQGGDFANPRGKAVETFSNIITEIRGYGEGFVIVEQSPVKLTPDVLKNTNVKLAHRIISQDDREALAGVMNLDEMGEEAMVSLLPGRAILFAAGMDRPVQVRLVEVKKRLSARKVAGLLDESPQPLPSIPESSQAELQRAFARWVLSTAFTHSTQQEEEARAAFTAHVRSLFPRALRDRQQEQALLRTTIPLLADRLAGDLGAFYGWTFADEAQFQKEIEQMWADRNGQAVQHRLHQDTQTEIAPFAGCHVCPAVCRYRLFAGYVLDEEAGQEGARLLEQYEEQPGASQLAALVLYGRYLSERAIMPQAEVASAVALCALVQLVHRQQGSDRLAAELTERVWSKLSGRDGGDEAW